MNYLLLKEAIEKSKETVEGFSEKRIYEEFYYKFRALGISHEEYLYEAAKELLEKTIQAAQSFYNENRKKTDEEIAQAEQLNKLCFSGVIFIKDPTRLESFENIENIFRFYRYAHTEYSSKQEMYFRSQGEIEYDSSDY